MKDATVLKQEIAEIKAANPRLRTRDLAGQAGLSEAEYLSLYTGEHVTRLTGDWKALLKSLKDMGYVMALTRNEHCVHERKGVYDNIRFYEGAHNVGVAVNPDIDLRFFMNEWRYGFAVIMPRGNNSRLYSFQFFNEQGEAVHKVFSTPRSNLEAYRELVAAYRSEDQGPLTGIDRQPAPPEAPKPDAKIDIAGFRNAWRNLRDTHDFFGMLKEYEVTRTQGLRLAPDGLTTQVSNDSVVHLLQAAADRQVPIMCFLHSKGCVQIHTGEVKNLKFFGDWYNVMDPKFNLHLKMPSIHETWIVRKPTADGIVTSLELFDENGQLIVYFFGARKPGKPELESWRDIVREVETAG